MPEPTHAEQIEAIQEMIHCIHNGVQERDGSMPAEEARLVECLRAAQQTIASAESRLSGPDEG